MGRTTDIKRKNRIIGRQENGARKYKRKKQNNEHEIEGKSLKKKGEERDDEKRNARRK
jgi:hypothetical protein